MNIKNYKRFLGTSLFCSLVSLSCGNKSGNKSEDDKIVFVKKLKDCLQTDSVDDFVGAVEESLTKFSSRIADSEYKDKQWKLPIEYLAQEGETIKGSREVIVADPLVLKKSFEGFLLQKFGVMSDDDKSSDDCFKEEEPEEPKGSPNSDDDDDDPKIPDGGSHFDDVKNHPLLQRRLMILLPHRLSQNLVLKLNLNLSLCMKLLRLHQRKKMIKNLKLFLKLKLSLL